MAARGTDTGSYATPAPSGVHVSLALNGSQDTGGAGVDSLKSIENLSGSAFNDTLTERWPITMCSRAVAGADTLNGGGGHDILIGGAGADILSGGGGGDTFVFNFTSESTLVQNPDTIVDFKHGTDTIDLSHIDANRLVDGDQAFAFIGSANFTHHAGELRMGVETDGLHIYGDTGGDGVADFSIILAHHGLILNQSDFLL